MSETHILPDVLALGEVTYPPGGTLGPRIQHSHQFVMVHTGEMEIQVDGERRHAPAGSISLLHPGHEETFTFATDRATRHSYVHFSYTPPPLALTRRHLPIILPLSTALQDLTRRLLDQRAATLSTRDLLQRALVAQLFWQYVGEAERGSGPRPVPALEHAEQYIRAHLDQPLTLAEIAAAAAVSPAHLTRLFHAEYDTTPVAFVWACRVQRGIDLLENTGLTVEQIAHLCGFQSSSHFSRRVRQACGLSPLAVRRRTWQGNS